MDSPIKAGAAAPTITSVALSGSNLVITWSAGVPPYQLQKRANLNASTLWVNEGSASATTTATVPATSGEYYYRVQSQ
jgi:hypothetical protein